MSSEIADKIFEPLFSTKDPGRGTGLSLATVRELVQRAGAEITVDTVPGRGSVFCVRFPSEQALRESHPKPKHTDAVQNKPHRTMTVLRVDDDDHVRSALALPLRGAGYSVLAVGDPRDTLAWFEQPEAPDLVVTDVIMPGLNGKELADACRRLRAGMPVLFITGYSEDVVFRRGVHHHAELLLKKPFSPGHLIAAAERLLGSSRPFQSVSSPLGG